MMHGFLSIDKPAGPTSHDVVARVRRLARQKRVGHAGTLDPAATGVLVVALGQATRLIEYIQEATTKRYYAVVRLGITTTTDDAEGQILTRTPLGDLDEQALEDALAMYRGPIQQIPPMFSALHHQGQRLHELARAGHVVDRPARPVTIVRLDRLGWSPPLLTLDVVCSKGTYIRALARDIGAALGCGGHLQELRRTAVGAFDIADAVPLATLEALASVSELADRLLPPEQAVADWPAIVLDDAETQRIRNGLPLVRHGLTETRARAHGPDGTLVALLLAEGERWKPEKVFNWAS